MTLWPNGRRFVFAATVAVTVSGCGDNWNTPYPGDAPDANTLYSAFVQRPKHLDPVQSYSEDEISFTAQVYEPPLQYHYLKRPYELIPLTAEAVPQVRYFDAGGVELPADADESGIETSVYEIRIQSGIHYQPHPAFARDAAGGWRYHDIAPSGLASIHALKDFKATSTRELTADDYVYQIKRLAHPGIHSPIFELMAGYIVGLRDYAKRLKKDWRAGTWLDLRQYPLPGVTAVDRHTYRITLKGKYPQFRYWLAMPFFSPMPWEADKFHAQPGMAERNLTLDWYPVGTGPYMLTENNPNARMVLTRNPNFRKESYPCEGAVGDREAGLLMDCGKPVPFIDRVVFSREKEAIPYWNKFLQGYYDAAGISSDNFDQAVSLGSQGEITLTEAMRDQGIRLSTSIDTSVSYIGFNMLDPVVGGTANPESRVRARKLRQALSIAIDQEDFLAIFLNGRGVPAMDPLPPGIFGHRDGEAGMNPVVYSWDASVGGGGAVRRKPVEEARRLLAEAGYPGGRDARTGEPLVIHLDTTAAGLGDKSRIDWLNKQLRRINVGLDVRSTDYNRFQEKVRKGGVQLFRWGWNADYPDPENMLFLLYGPQSKVSNSGENAANYSNPDYDRLFEQMRNMENGPARQAIIDRMLTILRNDAPWIFGFHPKTYSLTHQWLHNRKPNRVGHNTLKYQRIDVARRAELRRQWNPPSFWPVLALLLLPFLFALPAWQAWRQRESRRGLM